MLGAGAAQFEQTTEVERNAVRGEPAATILQQAIKVGMDEIIIGSPGCDQRARRCSARLGERLLIGAGAIFVYVRFPRVRQAAMAR